MGGVLVIVVYSSILVEYVGGVSIKISTYIEEGLLVEVDISLVDGMDLVLFGGLGENVTFLFVMEGGVVD